MNVEISMIKYNIKILDRNKHNHGSSLAYIHICISAVIKPNLYLFLIN